MSIASQYIRGKRELIVPEETGTGIRKVRVWPAGKDTDIWTVYSLPTPSAKTVSISTTYTTSVS